MTYVIYHKGLTMWISLSIFLSVVFLGICLMRVTQDLTSTYLKGIERIRRGLDAYLKTRAAEATKRSLADILETIYLDYKGGDPSIVAQGLALWLGALASRLSPPVDTKTTLAPVPEAVMRYVNAESEEWARQGMLARARELYVEFGNSWEPVPVALARETGSGLGIE